MKYLFLIPPFFALLMVACGQPEEQSRVVLHPDYELAPYAEADVQWISNERDLSEFSEELPGQVETLQRLLSANNRDNIVEIPVILRNSWGAKSVSIGDRLIFLHVASDQLLEYDMSEQRLSEVAPFGRGPGDIAYANELILDRGYLIVPREDHQLTLFDCNVKPCEYLNTTPIDKQGKSFATMNDHFAVMGGAIGGIVDDNISIYNADGEKLHSFGETYQTNDLYLHSIMVQGVIRSSETLGYYLLAYHRLPFLYLFNDQGELMNKFKLESYSQSMMEYDTATRRVSSPSQGGPEGGISNLFQVDDEIFVLSATSYGSSDFEYDREISFYMIHLSEMETYYIGSYHHQGDGNISVQLTDLGVVLIEGGEVSLFR